MGSDNIQSDKLPFRLRFLQWRTRWFNWEYWPMWMVYALQFLYLPFLALKARSVLFFTASNPNIETGGMLGESKWDIFKQIPQAFFPKTIFVAASEPHEQTLQQIQQAQLPFPIVAKPDRGERGRAVEKIQSFEQLKRYQEKANEDFLLQAWVNYPLELAVSYYRYPNTDKGHIYSITKKGFLQIVGDGQKTLQQLIIEQPRALLQYEKLQKVWASHWLEVIPNHETITLVPYGNHSRGAMFINANELNSPQLEAAFDTISKQIPEFYFGRFDLRCESVASLCALKDFAIVELNGAGAEPAHIYHPGFSFWEAQRVLHFHYKTMGEISILNHQRGIPYMRWADFRSFMKTRKANLLKTQS